MSGNGSSFYLDFYPRGLRKFFAIFVIFVTTFLPVLTAWKAGPESAAQPVRAFGPRFGNTRREAIGRSSSVVSRMPIFRTLLAMFGGALGLAIYYPRWGFKRYALLCGPILGLGSMWLVGWYLTGRTTVYRFETVFAALIGAFPGAALYVLLARRKWHKKNAAESIWIE